VTATLSALLALPAAAADTGVIVGAPEDRAAIEKLMWSYDRMLDTYDADAYVALFTPDGAFGQTKGREALHKMITDIKKGHDDRRAKGETITMRHFTMNQYLEFTGPATTTTTKPSSVPVAKRRPIQRALPLRAMASTTS